MSTESVAEIFHSLQDKTGCDDSAAATLTLAYYVGQLTTFSGGDMLAHGIAIGIRKGLWGVSADDDTGLHYGIGLGDLGEAIKAAASDLADAIQAGKKK